MKRLSDDTMNASDLEERLKQVQFTQDVVMKRTHTTAVVIQEATAINCVRGNNYQPRGNSYSRGRGNDRYSRGRGNNSSYNNRNSDSHPGSQTTSPTRPRGRGYRGSDRDREGYLKRVTVKQFDADGKEIYRKVRDYGEPGYDDQGYYGDSYDNQGYYGDGENFPMPEVE